MARAVPQLPSAAMLTHFTRRSAGSDAMDNLVAILRAGVIAQGLHAEWYAPGARSCVWFDAPLSELDQLLVRNHQRRYEPFGIAMDKRYAFAMGARPVIYMPWPEACQMLDREELWRVVAIDLGQTPPLDWTFEREWRIAEHLKLPAQGAVALVQTWRDVEDSTTASGALHLAPASSPSETCSVLLENVLMKSTRPGLAVMSGLALAAAFPKIDLNLFAWVASFLYFARSNTNPSGVCSVLPGCRALSVLLVLSIGL